MAHRTVFTTGMGEPAENNGDRRVVYLDVDTPHLTAGIDITAAGPNVTFYKPQSVGKSAALLSAHTLAELARRPYNPIDYLGSEPAHPEPNRRARRKAAARQRRGA